ncbi:hypothetical protein [Spirosoma sp.]|uniref:hypothetical protein n=1 Tax=Spirosoma sp. TaxID=1899569 RepID=UPI00260C6F7D|nr:hypothetical protein [Spirosoma sp.]MCX6216567.1 hypothetical protein [Spirosoma sp.]
MPVSTPIKPIDYANLKGDFFSLTDQVFKRLEAGEPIVEIAALSEETAIEIEERFNYYATRKNLPIYFTLTLVRPDVYRVSLDFGELEELP